MADDFTPQELQELEAELGEFASDFSAFESGGGGAEPSELSELNAAIGGTEFEEFGGDFGGAGEFSLSSMADNEFEEQFLGRFIKNKVMKLIRKLVALVKKYRKLASCVPKVTAAVLAFKAGKYATALRLAYEAYRCIKSKL